MKENKGVGDKRESFALTQSCFGKKITTNTPCRFIIKYGHLKIVYFLPSQCDHYKPNHLC